jgi:hypothetical protein
MRSWSFLSILAGFDDSCVEARLESDCSQFFAAFVYVHFCKPSLPFRSSASGPVHTIPEEERSSAKASLSLSAPRPLIKGHNPLQNPGIISLWRSSRGAFRGAKLAARTDKSEAVRFGLDPPQSRSLLATCRMHASSNRYAALQWAHSWI